MKRRIWLFVGFVLISGLILSGCEIFAQDQDEDLQTVVQTQIADTQVALEQIESIVAETLAAMSTSEQKEIEVISPTEEMPALLPEQAATPTLSFTDTPTAVPTATFVPTLAVPLAEVSVPTNCRTGPGKIFDKVSVLNVGKQVEVIAKNASGTYWVVKNPGGEGTCWLWDQYVSITGSTVDLPVWESPPTPTPMAGVTSPSEVTLKVSVPTNCRVGPGIPYEIVSILQVNKTVKVVARHASADFWVIENPGGSGTCWVWGEHATFTGAKGNLPIQAPPPAPTPQTTPGMVNLKVHVDTNCRVGPGIPYDIVTVLKIGKTATVVGRHPTADYWVIENPAGAGTCWVWGKYATLTGNSASLPVWDVPPTPTPTPVTLSVRVDTNCRVGPGIPYDIVTIFRIGQTAEVVGRNELSTFWVIKNPIGSGTCWLWGKYATLKGPSTSLPIWDPPSSP